MPPTRPRRGAHDRGDADRRREQVFTLVRAGWTYTDIGRALARDVDKPWGYNPDLTDDQLRHHVAIDVHRAIRHQQAHVDGLGAEHAALLNSRYEALLAAWWPAATVERLITNPVTQTIESVMPDARAAVVVLNALKGQRRLWGLDRPVKEPDATADEASARAVEAARALIDATERAIERRMQQAGLPSGPKVIDAVVEGQ